MKIRLLPADVALSKYVRLLSGGYCKRCWLLGKSGAYKGWKKLECAHYQGRRKRSTRWDLDNVLPLCFGCHSYIDGNRFAKSELFLEILGREKFEALEKRAQETRQVSQEKEKEIARYYREQNKILEVQE